MHWSQNRTSRLRSHCIAALADCVNSQSRRRAATLLLTLALSFSAFAHHSLAATSDLAVPSASNEPLLYRKDRRDSQLWALYFQDEFSLLDNLILNAGIRYDHYDSFGGTTSPRLALIYNWNKTTAKLLYGEAFRAPTVYEQYYSGTGLKANAHVKPERITTYEMKYSF